MPQRGQQLHKLGRLIRGLRAQETDAQSSRRQTVLLRRGKSSVERIDHLRNSARPIVPMGRIDDHVGVTRTVLRQPFGEAASQCRQLLRRAHDPADPVKELQKPAQRVAKAQQLLTWPWQLRAVLISKPNDVVYFEAPFKVNVDFRLRQSHVAARHTVPYSPGGNSKIALKTRRQHRYDVRRSKMIIPASCYAAAVVGSISFLTSVIFVAGKPLILACSLIMFSSLAR